MSKELIEKLRDKFEQLVRDTCRVDEHTFKRDGGAYFRTTYAKTYDGLPPREMASVQTLWNFYQAGAHAAMSEQKMSKELIEKLSDRVRPGSEAAPWVIEEIKRLEAALEAKAAPVAYITGQFAGRCIIEPINRAAVLPTGMALYSHPQPSAGVPEGYALIPQRMHLSEEAIESITVHCGDGCDDAGYGPYQDGVLWIGEIEEEYGTKTYGLHIATADYPECGITTLVEFARLNGEEVV